MGAGASSSAGAAVSAASDDHLGEAISGMTSDQQAKLLKALQKGGRSRCVADEATMEMHLSAPASLGKPAAPVGVSASGYAENAAAVDTEGVQRAKAGANKKRVLMVIDVQDGYDGGFISFSVCSPSRRVSELRRGRLADQYPSRSSGTARTMSSWCRTSRR